MEIKPKAKWQTYGTGKLVSARSPEHYRRLGIPVKKKHTGTANGMKLARAEFLGQLENPKAPHLVYVDESGMDERDNYGYGYSPCGERFYDLKSGRRQGRINMIAGYRDGQLIAPFTVEGSCNRTVFETWLETCLIPVLRPGQWVIVDNATFPERRSHCPIN